MLSEIIKSAMMGTSKFVPTALPPVMQEANEKIIAASEDREDIFLKLTAGYLLLEEAGKKLPENSFWLPVAPEEDKQFVSAEASALLNQFLKNKEDVLTEYFIYRCQVKGKVVLPALLPELLNRAVEKKHQRAQFLQVCGTRGTWLAGINPQWQQLLTPPEENIWETGTWEQRKAYFRALRQSFPAEALALLLANLQEETANNRAELLEYLQQSLSLSDEAFLTSQLTDRSTRVRQVAYDLLRSLHGSALYQALEAFARSLVSIKEERVLLITKKKVIQVNRAVELPEALAAAGIEKVSSQKDVQDADYWLAQTIAYLHPAFWQENYQLTPQEAVQLFTSHKEQKLWVPSLAQSAVRYGHPGMTTALLESDAVAAVELLAVLPLAERYKWAERFTAQHASSYLHLLLDEKYTFIPAAVCTLLLKQLMQQPYTINQQDYLRWALQMAPDMLPVLQGYIMQENETYQVRYFKNTCAEMSRIIQTREQLNASI
ncbi:DUF5691 domain-containing protein [Pontibacter saemangeumensis]|uniref:DUF5691 domain-containing protein n=1 Tax=Pontibacter saemangeumensis TaxID=1084525 RepID=A0ABP8M3J1_9BACT